MQQRSTKPAGKAARVARREYQRGIDRGNEEKNRRRAIGGGTPNELGVLQGQNAEQGNTVDRRNARPPGKLEH
jgi:hypothetical protein